MTVTTYLDFIAAFHIAWEAHDLKIKTQTGFASQSNGIVFQLSLIPISERTAGAEKKPTAVRYYGNALLFLLYSVRLCVLRSKGLSMCLLFSSSQ